MGIVVLVPAALTAAAVAAAAAAAVADFFHPSVPAMAEQMERDLKRKANR